MGVSLSYRADADPVDNFFNDFLRESRLHLADKGRARAREERVRPRWGRPGVYTLARETKPTWSLDHYG